ncbi:secondary thiamine-phosphate synthase enzyme YjbQ [Marinithermus hydrothermalis]|uniref:YjbQ family protein n=1 Tax=Marinithermus hydrothermalis (strain DSM 14884 / JCM 11576 / T1) TaxID=869210 RepID=F2NN13_MARHT|nr:secondary thiamine-phosphate synthase enzyme YjbQ [Marinithermus hydrothermalis]AEB12752.1 protein of unknown function UPF0047 [Marinithermus hydrothermalis DSM 14884]
MRRIQVRTPAREALVNVTRDLEAALAELGLREGALLVYAPHTTAGVVVQEGADPDVARDLLRRLKELVPQHHPADRHAEGNTDAHLKTLFTGNAQLLPVVGGRLALGRWQQVFLAEFDGPRTRELWLVPLAGRGYSG